MGKNIKSVWENKMKFINVINALVFVSITASVASIFYEGLTLQWYSFVPVIMIAADGLFIIATMVNLIFNRKNKLLFRFNIFSAVFIMLALVTKAMGIEHPAWAGTIWHFYILFLYFSCVSNDVYKRFCASKNASCMGRSL